MKAQRSVSVDGSGSTVRTTSATYRVAAHRVVLSGRDGVWNADLDDKMLDGSFATQAAAWEAAVREADRLDRIAATSRPPTPTCR
jgi:hypothetical protein